jgi:sigma-B regulation protein RsbU (phosphoserine phosphatase)
LSRPLERLVRGVQAYGAGDLSRRVDPGKRAPREIRRLSREFNGMADAIQQSMADIERETRQREQLESELRIAATLQQEMLPGGPYDGPGVELTGWSRPARQVGGDFYDYAGLGGDRLGVAVGDATDKGLPAALLVTECWSACEALFGGSHAPGEILGRVNEVMHGRLKGCGRFVTLLFLAIDEAAGELTFASAGHHPPFLVRADGSVEGLKPSPGFPIGIVEAASYGESRLACEAGDAVALYTDGVTDARSPDGELYGEGRLAAALARCAGQPAAAMAEGVRADIENYTGGSEPYDDMTLVVLRFK